MISKHLIVRRVLSLMEQKSTSKVKLGEILGAKGKTSQAKIQKVDRFLDTDNPRIDFEELEAVAAFFERPIEFFFTEEELDGSGNTLKQQGNQNTAFSQYGHGNTIHNQTATPASTQDMQDITAQLGALSPQQIAALKQMLACMKGE